MSIQVDEEERPAVWPWVVLLLLNLLTLAPIGIGGLIYNIRGDAPPSGLAWIYWICLLVFFGIGVGARKRKRLRAVVLGVAFTLLVINFGGCGSILKALSSIH